MIDIQIDKDTLFRDEFDWDLSLKQSPFEFACEIVMALGIDQDPQRIANSIL